MEIKPTYAVVDVETTMKCPIGENAASAFWPDNHVVLRGIARGDRDRSDGAGRGTAIVNPNETFGGLKFHPNSDGTTWPVNMLVGHNIGFDIHHMRVGSLIDEQFLGTVPLWDTQLAEYLLTAQRSTMVSLDELVEKYGGTKKDSRVTDLFKAGKGADQIDKDILKDYLIKDLENTEFVFFKQFEKAQEMGLVPLIVTQMDALAATIEMTYNGLQVDLPALAAGAAVLRKDVEIRESALRALADVNLGFPGINLSSSQQLSTLLFGGVFKYTVKKQVGITKAGKPVIRNVGELRNHKALFKPSGPLNGNGYYSTDEKTLARLLTETTPGRAEHIFIKGLLELRESTKQLTTYWDGLGKLVMPDGRIHHRLNHTVTRTGRLSSSEPNLQNVTNGDIKSVFVSRWGDKGRIVEADFKQLEMVELAIVSGDAQLIDDITHGVDMHDALYYEMHGQRLPKNERKSFKRCSFCLVYGGGAKAVAEQGGISETEAKRFIDAFYTRYKGVKKYHDDLIEWAAANRTYSGLKDADTGLPMGECEYMSAVTGRRYWFREYPTPWGKVNFSPSELKNYMVQGGATGDKVPLCIGRLYRLLMEHPTLRDKCLLINTVHDSVLFDVHEDVLDEALTFIKETMERTPEFYQDAFGTAMPLGLSVELSSGLNWKDQHEVNYHSLAGEWRQAA